MVSNIDISFSDFVEKSAAGFCYHFEDDCKRQKERMEEFLSNEAQLLSALDTELAKLNILESVKLEDMMYLLKTYQVRLHAIKERMRKASKKSARLKERSLRILQIKQKEALDRELRREAQLTREQEMVSKSPNFQTV